MSTTLIDGLKERISSSIAMYESVGIVLPGTNYPDLLQALFGCVKEKPNDRWVYITATRPFDNFMRLFGDMSKYPNVTFIDCISRSSGIVRTDEQCIYIESPTMLEKITMEAGNLLTQTPEGAEKYLILDSLTTLMIYNDPTLVTEFFYQLLNKARSEDVHTISLVVEEGELDKYINKLIYLNDKIIKVRDSFI
ncbi:MAG TPA: hypothetical protein ENI49_00425 [Thermoplasmatales archaeon]|nr:hypothetical protein [Thermoplasmatales archaeon]